MKKPLGFALILLPFLFSGCMASVGASGTISAPPDSKAQCESQCRSIGMGLGAVAIMANNVGCVCQATNGVAEVSGASITSGMATISMQQAAADRRRRNP